MKKIQHQMARKVKQLYLSAGHGETLRANKDGWSAVFRLQGVSDCAITARRHHMGDRGARNLTSLDMMREDLTYILQEWDGKLGAAGMKK